MFLILSRLATGLSWLCYFRALQLGEESGVASVDKLSVVFAIALGAIVLREQLTWLNWRGRAGCFWCGSFGVEMISLHQTRSK
jgi:transporter family protein